MQAITFQAIPILIDGHDTQGQLVLFDHQLVAVLARLDGDAHDPAMKSWWNLEAGFGPARRWGTTSSRRWMRPGPGSVSGSLSGPLAHRLNGSQS